MELVVLILTWYVPPDPPVGLETVITPLSSPLHTTFVVVIVALGEEVDNVTELDDVVEHKLVSLTSILYVPVVNPLKVLLDPH